MTEDTSKENTGRKRRILLAAMAIILILLILLLLKCCRNGGTLPPDDCVSDGIAEIESTGSSVLQGNSQQNNEAEQSSIAECSLAEEPVQSALEETTEKAPVKQPSTNSGSNSSKPSTNEKTPGTDSSGTPQGNDSVPSVSPGTDKSKPETTQPTNPAPAAPSNPKPEPKGHYEKVWVVDQAAWDEDVYEEWGVTICKTCGADITSKIAEHGMDHMDAGENFSYYNDTIRIKTGTIHHDEIGHYEDVWISE